ncbi:MAG: GxxExxY protein [Bacteroidia bacterium]|nr:GxxExxY protein [Bacteroidia bacterium]
MITQTFLESLSYKTIKCIYEVHNQLGPGLLEAVYMACLVEELRSAGLTVLVEPHLPILYKNKDLGGLMKPDLVVESQLILELKAVEVMIPVFNAQLLTYLKLSGINKGLLVNFNCENMQSGITSLVTPSFFKLPKL